MCTKCNGKECFRCSKFFFYILNLLFWMIGVALMGFGVWFHISNSSLQTVSPGYNFLMPAVLSISAGVLSVIIGFLGCCGAIVENKCMIITYVVFVIIIFGVEISGGIAAFIGSEELSFHVYNQLNISLTERYPSEAAGLDNFNQAIVGGWDHIQTEFKCCGIHSYTDWFKSHGWPSQNKVPDSCCVHAAKDCGEIFFHGAWYGQGCIELIKDFLKSQMCTVGIVIMVFAGLQLLAVVGGLLYLKYWRRRKSIN